MKKKIHTPNRTEVKRLKRLRRRKGLIKHRNVMKQHRRFVKSPKRNLETVNEEA